MALCGLQLAAPDRTGRCVPGAVCDLSRNEPDTPVCGLLHVLELRREFARYVSRRGRNAHRQGIAIPQLLKTFPDDGTAGARFESKLWPNGPFCPHGGSTNVQSGITHKTMTCRCRS